MAKIIVELERDQLFESREGFVDAYADQRGAKSLERPKPGPGVSATLDETILV
jgi:hypothetical protein